MFQVYGLSNKSGGTVLLREGRQAILQITCTLGHFHEYFSFSLTTRKIRAQPEYLFPLIRTLCSFCLKKDVGCYISDFISSRSTFCPFGCFFCSTSPYLLLQNESLNVAVHWKSEEKMFICEWHRVSNLLLLKNQEEERDMKSEVLVITSKATSDELRMIWMPGSSSCCLSLSLDAKHPENK